MAHVVVPPLVSAIVCTHDRAGLLTGAVDSLLAQTLDRRAYEILVVDNASTDATPSLVARWARQHDVVRAGHEAVLGVSGARNAGVRMARGEIVAFMDDDARAAPDWLERIVAAFRIVEPAPGVVGGPIRPIYEAPRPSWLPPDFDEIEWGTEPWFLHGAAAEGGFAGSNMAFRRDILADSGGFSDDFGHRGRRLGFGDESELFARLSARGVRLWYDPRAVVHHWVPRSRCTVPYRLRVGFEKGKATSRLRRSAWLSRKAVAVVLRAGRAVVNTAPKPEEPRRTAPPPPVSQRVFLHAHDLAFLAGRIAGVRLLRSAG